MEAPVCFFKESGHIIGIQIYQICQHGPGEIFCIMLMNIMQDDIDNGIIFLMDKLLVIHSPLDQIAQIVQQIRNRFQGVRSQFVTLSGG